MAKKQKPWVGQPSTPAGYVAPCAVCGKPSALRVGKTMFRLVDEDHISTEEKGRALCLKCVGKKR